MIVPRSKGKPLVLAMALLAGAARAQQPPPIPVPRSLSRPVFTAAEGSIAAVAALPEARMAVQVGPQHVLLLNAAGTVLSERKAEGLARLLLATDGLHVGRVGFRRIPLTGEIVQDSFTLLDENGEEAWTWREEATADVTEFRVGSGGRVLGIVREPGRGIENRVLFFGNGGKLLRTVSLPYLLRVSFHDEGRKILAQTRDRLVMLKASGSVDRELLPSPLAAASRDGEDLVLFRRNRLSILPGGVATLDLDFGSIRPVDLQVSRDGTRAVLVSSKLAVVVRFDPPGLAFTAGPARAGESIRTVVLQEGEEGFTALGTAAEAVRGAGEGAARRGHGILLDAEGRTLARWELEDLASPAADLPGVAFLTDDRHLVLWTAKDLYVEKLPAR